MSRTQSPIDIMEDAIHLLRRTPVETYALFLVGITPFVLCLFNFCSEMSYSELAASNLTLFAATLALLYLWMKGFQALACRSLKAAYTGEPPETFRSLFKALICQATIQPIGLFARPMAALISLLGYSTFVPPLLLPAAVTFSFFQNASIVYMGGRGDLQKCWHLSLSGYRGTVPLLYLYLLLRVVIFLNVYLTVAALPYLLKALFGIDTFLSRDFRWLISFPYLVGIGLISYFVVDLLIKAIEVIRVCRAEAQTTGLDLRQSLLSLITAKKVSLVLFCLLIPTLIFGADSPHTPSGVPGAPGAPGVVGVVGAPGVPDAPFLPVALKRASPSPDLDRIPESELNHSIERELTSPEYGWRKPQQHLISPETNWIQRFAAWLGKTLNKIRRAFNQVVDTISKWWKSLFPGSESPPVLPTRVSAPNWINQLLICAMIGGLILATALIVARLVGRSRKTPPLPVGAPVPVVPNLESDTTLADELPEDEWVLLARRKLEEGELRLALRAFFLAMLSLLGSQRLIIVRRSKSNADYESELKRRRTPELTELFGSNRRLFERCWYGDHPVTEIEIEQSNRFYQRLKHACLAQK
jgi:hypothetical protein